ncbi:MAG TPA: ATP-binding protein [Gemmatimonadaceae bacterium]|nr:ATP-binding protein [Gemmatimonadaceae bacterium]
MRPVTKLDDPTRQTILDPHRILRWVHLARLAMSGAIFVAAVLAWKNADEGLTLTASLLITGALVFTSGSALYSGIHKKPLGTGFFYSQSLFDLVVVTTIVHVTGSGNSQFAALYILVIAAASLLLPYTGGLLIAALGCVLYFADVIITPGTPLDLGVWLQLGVFAAVALGSGFIAARLRQAGAGTVQLAAELEKVRLQAADILKNIRSGIVTVDASGGLVYANPAASQLLGIPLDEHLGSRVIETISDASPELARALGRAARDGTRTSRAEGTITVRDRRFPIGLNTTRSEGDGAATATATAIFQDISDQKRLDTLNARAERLEAVAELSASLAHEIKNPLAAIRSAVETLGRSPRSNADERTLADLIVRESDRLSRLLSEFLDFARVRVARVEPLDLAALARGAASLAAAHPDRPNDVQVVCVGANERMVVEGDEDLLHRAVFNLALNAVQASPHGGRVRVELAPLSMDQVPAGVSFDHGGVALRVSDDGPGIPVEIRDRLFDPFFTTKPGGSGLGLSIVHRAIEAHAGFVFVDSDDRGTRVTVLLPSHQSDNGELV